MRSDIRRAKRISRYSRIKSPQRLIRTLSRKRCNEPILRKFRSYVKYIPDCPIIYHLSCLANHGISRKRICQPKHKPFVFDYCFEVKSLFNAARKRLVTHNVYPVFKKTFSYLIMAVIRRGYRYKVNPVISL